MQVIDYDWSPDGKWLVYARMDGSFASELYIVPVDRRRGEERHALRHLQRRRHLEQDRQEARPSSASGAAAPSAVTSCRCRSRPSPGAAAGGRTSTGTTSTCASSSRRRCRPTKAAISPDGSRVAFRSPASGDDLWVASADGRQVDPRDDRQPAAAADPLVASSSGDSSTSATATARSAWPTSACRCRRRPEPVDGPVHGQDDRPPRRRVPRDVRAELAAPGRELLRPEVPRRRLERGPRPSTGRWSSTSP